MKTRLIRRLGSLTVILLSHLTLFAQPEQIDIGIAQGAGSELIVSFTAQGGTNYTTMPNNQWNGHVITIRWSTVLGTGVMGNPVNIHGCPQFYFKDGAPIDGLDGFYYQKIIHSTLGQPCSFSPGVVKNMFTIPVSHGSISSGTFELSANPPGSVFGGTMTLLDVDNVEQFSGILNPSSVAVPLPIKLSHFHVRSVQNEDAQLEWTTLSEENASHFIVQRLEGNAWIDIGQVQAAGTSSELRSYTFLDKNASQSVWPESSAYYRLQMVDLDWTYEYSPVRTADFKQLRRFSVYPNPADISHGIYIVADLQSGLADLNVYDASGHLVHTEYHINFGNGAHHIDFQKDQWPPGVYFIRILQDEKVVSHHKMVLKKRH